MIKLPTNDLEKQEILKETIKSFKKDVEYYSSDVIKILEKLGVEDSVLIRRELANFGYFKQDPYRNKYVVEKYELSEDELDKIKERFKGIKEA